MTIMNRAFVAITTSVLGATSMMAAGLTLNSNNPQHIIRTVGETHPFTHLAYIPVGANLSSIKFQGVKKVKVATQRKSTTDVRYCKDQEFRDPGGSMYCPYLQLELPSTAYQVTYSYDGQALSSDEYGSTHFTFSVYFRPDELSRDIRNTLTKHTISRADLAGYFELSSHWGRVQQVAVDEAASTFCEGNFIDGNWTHRDSKCQDKVHYAIVNTPSDYITVQVDPALARQEHAASVLR